MRNPPTEFRKQKLKPAGRFRLARQLAVRSAVLAIGILAANAATLQIEITPKVAGEDLQPHSLRYRTVAGEPFSITRVSYLVSDFALQRNDGSWLEISNTVGWLDARQGRNGVRLETIPPGDYRSVRFAVGLNTNLNHSDPATFAAGHPLNPNFNGLHWSWQGGYIFLALEGLWRNVSGELDGWSYHLARDPNCTRLTVAAALDLTRDTRLDLDFDLGILLKGPRALSFTIDGSSTHAREGDFISAALAHNLAGAFRVRKISVLAETRKAPGSASTSPLYLPKRYTPYRFQLSATFPVPDLPRDNPLTEERVALGRALFHDPSLSRDGTISCASCHQSRAAFSDSRPFSFGVEGRTGTRNAMPLFNLAWKHSFFWDGRAPSLRAQALIPIQEHNEMDEALANVVAKLSARTNYPALFAAAFDSPAITGEKLGLALEQFLLTLTSFDAKFDRVLSGRESFTPDEQRGFELFATEYDPRRGQFGADCFHCHGGALFQSQTFANNGLDAAPADPGRAKVTGQDSDYGTFAVPSLRNVELTAPYMHDGRFETLDEVVAHYAGGVKRSRTLDPNLAKHPDGGVPLTEADQRALVAFLKTLTDERFRVQPGRVERAITFRE